MYKVEKVQPQNFLGDFGGFNLRWIWRRLSEDSADATMAARSALRDLIGGRYNGAGVVLT